MKQFIFATIFILGGLLLSSTALALTVSPVKLEISGDPGEIVKGEILLMNEKEGTKTFYSSFENFEATGETGTPTFIPAKEGLATWIEAESQIILESGEQKKVSYEISIPQDADPGGHFAAIFWSASPPQAKEGGNVSIAAKLGVLVLLKVTGEIEEGVGIIEFSAENERNFFSSLPVDFYFRFKNSGGDRVKPVGEITIKDAFGKIAAVLPVNESEGNVLPQSIRKFEASWEKIQKDKNGRLDETKIENNKNGEEKGFFQELKKEWRNFAFGKYTAELNLECGEEKTQASFSFFIVPWRTLCLAVFLLIILSLFLIKGIKKYNRWVVAKAKVAQ